MRSHREMWRDPDEVLNQNGDIHVLTLMPFPTPSHTLIINLVDDNTGQIIDVNKRIDELPTADDYDELQELIEDQAKRLRRNKSFTIVRVWKVMIADVL